MESKAENTETNKLTNSDYWFAQSLKALLGGEEALIRKGKKKEIDRKMLREWIDKNTAPQP